MPLPSVPADALVVFGAKVTEHGPCPELRARLDHGVALWRAGVAPVVIVSGGVDGELDENEVMAAYVQAAGVPPADVRIASPGDNTRMALRALAPGRQYIAVSSPSHAHRIAAEAHRQGLVMELNCPAFTPEVGWTSVYHLRLQAETLGSILYALPESWAPILRRRLAVVRRALTRPLSQRSARAAQRTAPRSSQ